MPLSLDKSGTVSLLPPRRGTALSGTMSQGLFCVQLIYFSPVVREPVTSVKLVTLTSKHVEQG